MRTTTLFKLMGMVVMACAFAFTTNLKAQNDSNFITNDEVADGLVVSKIIYRMDGALYKHMKYDFTYDTQNRMTSKEALKWDGVAEKWAPYFKMSYTYTDNQIILEYARWSDKSKAYNESVEKSIYELNDANMPVACTNIESNGSKTDVKVN